MRSQWSLLQLLEEALLDPWFQLKLFLVIIKLISILGYLHFTKQLQHHFFTDLKLLSYVNHLLKTWRVKVNFFTSLHRHSFVLYKQKWHDVLESLYATLSLDCCKFLLCWAEQSTFCLLHYLEKVVALSWESDFKAGMLEVFVEPRDADLLCHFFQPLLHIKPMLVAFVNFVGWTTINVKSLRLILCKLVPGIIRVDVVQKKRTDADNAADWFWLLTDLLCVQVDSEPSIVQNLPSCQEHMPVILFAFMQLQQVIQQLNNLFCVRV